MIELAGLPGSGKSTVAPMAATLAAASALSVPHVPLMRLAVRHPVRTAVVTGRLLPAARSRADCRALVRLAGRGLSQQVVGIRQGAILEQGIVHSVVGALTQHPSLEGAPWHRLLEDIHYPLVVLDLDASSSRDRIERKAARGPMNERLSGSSPDGNLWGRLSTIYELVVATATRYRPVYRIDATASPKSIARCVAEYAAGTT